MFRTHDTLKQLVSSCTWLHLVMSVTFPVMKKGPDYFYNDNTQVSPFTMCVYHRMLDTNLVLCEVCSYIDICALLTS